LRHCCALPTRALLEVNLREVHKEVMQCEPELVLDNSAETIPPPLSPTKAQLEWKRCRHWIEESIATGSGLDSIEDVERILASNNSIFWAGKDCAAITRIDEYSNRRVLTVAHAGGNVDGMLEGFLPQLDYFAKNMDCQYIGVEVDEAHVVPLKEKGFALTFTTLMRPVGTLADGDWKTNLEPSENV
jgi:hypothetical protein